MSRALPVAVLILVAAVIVRAVQSPAPAATLHQAPTYWCPMHPDERAASAVTCPICKMRMVPVPPMRVGEYRMDVASIGAPKGRGLAGIRVTLRDPERNALVTTFETVHEKPLHVFIIGRDLQFFRHLHAESVMNGQARFMTDIPPGEYMVVADFLPSGGSPQLLQRAIISPGPESVRKGTPAAASVVEGGVRVQPTPTSLIAGNETIVTVVLTRAADGQPVLDLQPYLGASAHLLVVSADLSDVIHGHPAEWNRAEPVLKFDLTLPRPGEYRAWLQFQRAGVVVTAALTFTAR